MQFLGIYIHEHKGKQRGTGTEGGNVNYKVVWRDSREFLVK